jgi:hypothetical protein
MKTTLKGLNRSNAVNIGNRYNPFRVGGIFRATSQGSSFLATLG